MIFNYNSRINFHRLLNLINIKKLEILDFGCGNGIWELSKINNKRIKKIVLYDKNKKLLPKLRKKYKNIKIKKGEYVVMSSLVNVSLSLPTACKYIQSGLLQDDPRMK